MGCWMACSEISGRCPKVGPPWKVLNGNTAQESKQELQPPAKHGSTVRLCLQERAAPTYNDLFVCIFISLLLINWFATGLRCHHLNCSLPVPTPTITSAWIHSFPPPLFFVLAEIFSAVQVQLFNQRVRLFFGFFSKIFYPCNVELPEVCDFCSKKAFLYA